MALQIEWTPDALEHFNEILEYWIERNGTKEYSKKLYKSVRHVLSVLSRYPESGKLTEKQSIRSKIVKDYFIFYSYTEELLIVVGFCDMRRDPNYLISLLK